VGGLLIREPRRHLLPDALLVRPDRLLRGVGFAAAADGSLLGLLPESAAPAQSWERFPGEVWTAAPVLAHAHLDGWDAPRERLPREPFADWIRALLAWRSGAGRLAPARSAERAAERLAAAGCALAALHVGETGAEGPADLGVEWLAWREVLDPFPDDPPEDAARRWRRAAPPCHGLALHAPYTVDLGLARAVFARGGPVSLHFGETGEERECLARGAGPLAELLAERRGRRPEGRWPSPLAWLAEAGGLRGGVLAVHASALDAEELRALRRAGVGIVFCPGTHLWFGRGEPAFAGAGVFPDALGCDSRASNDDLDPLREFRLALRLLPGWSPQAAWRALTEGGAAALGRPHAAGFAPGAPLRALRLADPRAHAAAASPDGAAALLGWLAGCEDPHHHGARIPPRVHA
jgi:cytosine/adenosine deaminase-related metal-dependent hydrolase